MRCALLLLLMALATGCASGGAVPAPFPTPSPRPPSPEPAVQPRAAPPEPGRPSSRGRDGVISPGCAVSKRRQRSLRLRLQRLRRLRLRPAGPLHAADGLRAICSRPAGRAGRRRPWRPRVLQHGGSGRLPRRHRHFTGAVRPRPQLQRRRPGRVAGRVLLVVPLRGNAADPLVRGQPAPGFRPLFRPSQAPSAPGRSP